MAAFTPPVGGPHRAQWYWLLDGIVIERLLHLFALGVQETGGGHFDFAPVGVWILSLPVGEAFRTDRALGGSTFLRPENQPGRSPILFGSAISPEVLKGEEGEMIHVYGVRTGQSGSQLFVARVRPLELREFAAWRYWDGEEWSPDLRKAASLAERVSVELSVTPLTDGRNVLIFELDGVGRQLAARVSRAPTGPFGPPSILWSCPEAEIAPDVYCYNAKAHPHLSDPGSLLVSYNVNRTDPSGLEDLYGLYRPRFLRVPLELLDPAAP